MVTSVVLTKMIQESGLGGREGTDAISAEVEFPIVFSHRFRRNFTIQSFKNSES